MIGQRFGNYRALSLLGEGGMGAVYLAEHPDIGRRVAVKVLRPELIRDPQLLLRFLNEARAANAIRHPNIIEILDSGTTTEGTPYLVMELLEGEVLSGRIQRVGKLPLAEALEFAYQTASALAAAHDKGIIHRDLKPDNLFIIRDPSDPTRERVKVLDFGIAKLQTFPSGGGMHTRTGTLMGTPVYMSPEQCLGTRTVDRRSDIYALGVIMYEMLAGRPPFISEGFGELVNMHLNVKPRPLRELDPTIPEPVAALIAKMLEKAPDARPRSAEELQLDIRGAAGKAIVIRGVSSPDLASATLPGAGIPAGVTGQGSPRGFSGATTLSTGTGERHVVTLPVTRAATGRRLVLAAVVIAGVGGAVLFGIRRGRESQQTTTPRSTDVNSASTNATGSDTTAGRTAQTGSEQRITIHVTIDSEPSGAVVKDVEAGRLLGTTPVAVQREKSQGPLSVRVEKPGFLPLTRALEFDHDRTETLALSPAPTDPAQATGTTAVRDKHPSDKIKKGPPRPHHPTAVHPDDEPAKL